MNDTLQLIIVGVIVVAALLWGFKPWRRRRRGGCNCGCCDKECPMRKKD